MIDEDDDLHEETQHESKLGHRFSRDRIKSALFANSVVACLLILQVGTVTMLKRASCLMENYPFTLTQMQPFSTTIAFSALYFISTKISWPASEGYISIEERDPFPKYKLAILGGLFTLSNFALFSGSRGEYLSGPLLTLFQQVVVPCTIAMSIILLRRKFSPLHYLGAAIIIVGIVFTIWPKLITGGKEQKHEWWAAGLVMISTLFQATAIVYMEKNLKEFQMPFLSSWAWINVFELVLTIPLVIMIPPVQGISFRDIPKNVLYGYECFFANHNPANNESCGHVGLWFIVFIVFLVSNKLLMTYIIKEGSSSLAMVSLTCALPLSNIVFTSHNLVGRCAAASLYWRDFVGLAMVVFGLMVYRYSMFKRIFRRKRITQLN